VVNSNRLAQVNDNAGLIHPAAFAMTLPGNVKTIAADYTGDTLEITVAAGAGGTFVDQATLMKWVDASVTNGCDDAAGKEQLAGHEDVRGTAHVLIKTGGVCTSPTTAGGVANAQTASAYVGRGRNLCQSTGGTYTAVTALNVGFSYAKLTATGVTAATSPSDAKWRLCMTSPSVADNTVFADTGLTITAKCTAAKHSFVGNNCVCAENKGLPDAANTPGHCANCPAGKYSNVGGLCAVCPQGKYSGGAGTACVACPVGTAGAEQSGGLVPGGGLVADMCKVCPTGTYNDATGSPHKSDCKGCGVGAFAKADLGMYYTLTIPTTDFSANTEAIGAAIDQATSAAAGIIAVALDAAGTTKVTVLSTNGIPFSATGVLDFAGATADTTPTAVASATSADGTLASSHDAYSDVCTSECGANKVGDKAVYGLTVTDGIWSNTAKSTSATDWSTAGDTPRTTLTAATADFGTYANKDGQFSQCVLAADCKLKGLLADPMTKTCVAACPSGLKPDAADLHCILASCAANQRSVSTLDAASAKVTFACEACAAGKTSNVAFNYHAAGALTISAAAGDMDGEGDTILKALPSSATIKDVFKAERYTTTQCLEVRVCISCRMTLTD
jgi:filamentous hemagglutinin family protein